MLHGLLRAYVAEYVNVLPIHEFYSGQGYCWEQKPHLTTLNSIVDMHLSRTQLSRNIRSRFRANRRACACTVMDAFQTELTETLG